MDEESIFLRVKKILIKVAYSEAIEKSKRIT